MIEKERMDKLSELVKTFEQKIDEVKSPAYNEDNLRVDFVDKFFEYVLGWDVRNKNNDSEDFREVYREDKVYVKGKPKAPDYSFRIGGKRIFFLETKKPSVSLEKNPEPALQIRWYGHSARVGMSILTNFEHFIIYDTRIAPKSKDKFDTAILFSCNYKEYAKHFEFLYNTISNEAVRQGKLKNWLGKDPKGSLSVDKGILNLIEDWRTSLAKNIAVKNTELDIFSLNRSVQKIIDRIIFLRIAEDRGIEDYSNLSYIADNPAIFKHLTEYFEKANKKYNSGLFSSDAVLNGLKIDSEILEDIIKNLYFPKCPYEFSFLPIEILGNIYEQFLGKTIHLTPGHNAKVEEKPEVRKAGGVYYTPQYIVDYIVKNTVGEQIKDKTPKDIEGLKILDPACGSGSFLIGAYTFLLNHHLNYYTRPANIQKALKEERIYKTGEEKVLSYHLSIKEKQNILLNNIYGVDIDSQAVEVSRLSLLLKLMEGENQESVGYFFKHSDLKPLPDLKDNIKCGNSLIASDFYEGKLIAEIPPEEIHKINAFDWEGKDGFPDIMKSGGFDVVIGNPPYLRIQGLQDNYKNQIDYYIEKYKSAVKRFDIYLLFIENGFKLLNEIGLLGYICPHKFTNSDFGSGIREFLLSNLAVNKIISFGHNLIFEQASVYTGLFFLSKEKHKKFRYYEFSEDFKTDISNKLLNIKNEDFSDYDLHNFTDAAWILSSSSSKIILDKFSKLPKLKDVFSQIFQGVVTGYDDIYYLQKINNQVKDIIQVHSIIENKDIEIERELLKPMLKGDDIKRYQEPDFMYYSIYPYRLVNGKTIIYEEDELQNIFPRGYNYLKKYFKELKDLRVKFKTNPKYWYSCHRGRDMNIFEQERIITPYASLGCNMTISKSGLYHNTKVYSLLPNDRQENKKYWLSLLNSKIMWYFIKNTGYVLRGGYYTFTTDYLSPFPVKPIDFSQPIEKQIHDDIVMLVDQIMGFQKQFHSTNNEGEKQTIKKQIDNIDAQIDSLVYSLYGLTKEEIKIIEADNGK